MPNYKTHKPVIFLAPGAGLGHLVRSAALCLELQDNKIPSVIASSSPWAKGFGRITGIQIVSIPPSRWKYHIVECLEALTPSLIVQDSFPFGFRGEDLSPLCCKIPFIYIARRLRIDRYLAMLNKTWDKTSPLVSNILVSETLDEIHTDLVIKSSSNPVVLDSKILFPNHRLSPPELPAELNQLIKINIPLHLVVHSGPGHETNQLINLAENSIRKKGVGKIAVINPGMSAQSRRCCYDYFPSSGLYGDVYRIYTGAGYNCVSEAEAGGKPEKHVMIPFPRHYDDQEARLKAFQSGKQDGTPEAIQFILEMYTANQHKFYARNH